MWRGGYLLASQCSANPEVQATFPLIIGGVAVVTRPHSRSDSIAPARRSRTLTVLRTIAPQPMAPTNPPRWHRGQPPPPVLPVRTRGPTVLPHLLQRGSHGATVLLPYIAAPTKRHAAYRSRPLDDLQACRRGRVSGTQEADASCRCVAGCRGRTVGGDQGASALRKGVLRRDHAATSSAASSFSDWMKSALMSTSDARVELSPSFLRRSP